MFKLLSKIFLTLSKFILTLFFWGMFLYVVFFVSYPKTLTSANFLQIAPFFLTLFLAVALTVYLVFKNFLISALASLGVVILLILKGLDSLNLVSGGLTILAIGLLISYFKKNKRSSRLTSGTKIPRLIPLRRQK